MNNSELNSLVVSYQTDRNDDTFTKIYEIIANTWTNLEKVAKSVRADIHEITALYEDALLKCIDKYDGKTDFIRYYRHCLKRARADLYKYKKLRYESEIKESTYEIDFECLINSDNDVDSTAATVLETKRADQRQLIDYLLSGADATTTAIVEAFLSEKKPTPTAIGKKLGLHHSTVLRKLTRMASKYDSKKFGDYRDFLVVRS
jgi:hypothetical protein